MSQTVEGTKSEWPFNFVPPMIGKFSNIVTYLVVFSEVYEGMNSRPNQLNQIPANSQNDLQTFKNFISRRVHLAVYVVL